MKARILSLLLLLPGLCMAQGNNAVFPAQVFYSSGQTGATIRLTGTAFSVGNISLTGTSLTTATLSVYGSSDGGVTYYQLPLTTVASPGSTPTTTVTATASGLYQVNLVGITHVKFVTSGTFTATSVSLVLSASPNGALSRNGGGGGVLPSGITASVSAPVSYVTNMSPYLLPHWVACTAKVRIDAGNCRVYATGDSTTFGAYSAGTAGTGDLTVAAYPTRLSQYLNSSVLPAQRDSWMGGGNDAQSVVANDARVVVGSWATINAATYSSTGGYMLCSSATGTGMSFTPTDQVSSFTIWYPTSPGFATIAYNIDGGTSNTFSENVANGVTSIVASTTLGTHTLNISYSSGSSHGCIIGVEASNAAIGSVQIINAGWSGSTSSSWNVATTAWNPINSVPAQAPDLILLDLGINDWSTGVTVAAYTANMQALITACKATSDIILVTPAPSANATIPLATQQPFVAAMYQLAFINNLPIIDNFSRWGSYERTNPAPFLFYNQAQHPSANGYSDFAEAIAIQLSTISH